MSKGERVPGAVPGCLPISQGLGMVLRLTRRLCNATVQVSQTGRWIFWVAFCVCRNVIWGFAGLSHVLPPTDEGVGDPGRGRRSGTQRPSQGTGLVQDLDLASAPVAEPSNLGKDG